MNKRWPCILIGMSCKRRWLMRLRNERNTRGSILSSKLPAVSTPEGSVSSFFFLAGVAVPTIGSAMAAGDIGGTSSRDTSPTLRGVPASGGSSPMKPDVPFGGAPPALSFDVDSTENELDVPSDFLSLAEARVDLFLPADSPSGRKSSIPVRSAAVRLSATL